jgi:hypothetical protein
MVASRMPAAGRELRRPSQRLLKEETCTTGAEELEEDLEE